MFWGNGDSSKLTPEARATLEELRRLVESGHIVGLSPDQSKQALNAINFYSAITATSGLLAGIRNVAYWVAGLGIFWWTSKDVVVAFLKTTAAGG